MNTFLPTDLLLPQDRSSQGLSQWAVLASDQFINEESYWQSVEEYVGRAPSTLRLILPESCLDGPDMETDIMSLNSAMSEYLRKNVFTEYPQAMVLVERRLPSGGIRWGIMGMLDLEEFDYGVRSSTPIRASETILTQRIPPRVATRKNAPLEVSHVVLLADDRENLLTGDLDTNKLELLYDFPLMEEGGHLRGWLLGEAQQKNLEQVIAKFAEPSYFQEKYNSTGALLQFALGDGNHALATAKECYERQKKLVRSQEWDSLPARYALVELVNLHQDAVTLESFHRIITSIDPNELLRDFRVFVEKLPENDYEPQDFMFHYAGHEAVLTVKHPVSKLYFRTFESFLLEWLPLHKKALVKSELHPELAIAASEKANTLCIILPQINKEDLFPSLVHEGILPKKTFSFGMERDKKYYLEARKIR